VNSLVVSGMVVSRNVAICLKLELRKKWGNGSMV